jgi:hypothetical protein
LYWKLVIVAESTLIVHVALDTTRPAAAEASLGVTAFCFLSALPVTVADGLPDGDALPVADGSLAEGVAEAEPDALGVAVGLCGAPDVLGSAVGVGDGDAEALGDGVGDGSGDDALGLGVGVGDEPKQKITSTQVWVGVGVGVAACAAATARPPPNPMTPAVNSSAARDSTARRFMPAPPRSPGQGWPALG